MKSEHQICIAGTSVIQNVLRTPDIYMPTTAKSVLLTRNLNHTRMEKRSQI